MGHAVSAIAEFAISLWLPCNAQSIQSLSVCKLQAVVGQGALQFAREYLLCSLEWGRCLVEGQSRAEASTSPLVDGYVHVQNGMNFDVEANMATATVCSSSPHMT